MAFNAYLVFHQKAEIKGESSSQPDKSAVEKTAIEITDYGFGVSMPVTPSRSDGGGATVGRANFDVFTCSKNVDTATVKLFEYCCKGTDIQSAVLHIYRSGDRADSGAIKYAMVVFQHCVVTKVAITGSGEELPKETLEFNYGKCEYQYKKTKHETGEPEDEPKRFGWSTIKNIEKTGQQSDWDAWFPEDASKTD